MAAALSRGALQWIRRLAEMRAVLSLCPGGACADTPSGCVLPAGGLLWYGVLDI
jgi:hypothetical protein